MARPGGLGRGLGALIPSTEAGVGAADRDARASRPETIQPNPHQPREYFDEEALNALAESIREVGVLQPVLVREADDGYELIAGERRWRRARARSGSRPSPRSCGWPTTRSPLQQAIVENVQREALDPLEEAAAYQQLIEDFKLTHDDVARRVGKSRATVTNCLRHPPAPADRAALHPRRIAEARPRHRVARDSRPRVPGAARPPRGRRGPLGPRGRGNGPDAQRAGGRAGRARAGRKLRPPGLPELENLLSDHLDTRVSVRMSDVDRRGRVVVEFADLEDLERIYRRMTDGTHGPDERSVDRDAQERYPSSSGSSTPAADAADDRVDEAARRGGRGLERGRARRGRRVGTRPRPCGSRAGCRRRGRRPATGPKSRLNSSAMRTASE